MIVSLYGGIKEQRDKSDFKVFDLKVRIFVLESLVYTKAV
jgi:hypothetical protein